ncbi:MAG: hypothetical protein Q8N88_04585 [Nanoarchaeota archaeon]|nr:hypothetical protein [Nanoarchaeota archaeon]
MPKAIIKLKSGAVVTIEGSASEVTQIVSDFKVENNKKKPSKIDKVRKAQKKKAAASDYIIEFRETGFFNKPKGLGEIAKALEEKGHLYPLTTLSGVVLDLIRARELGRKKTDGRWVYGKR